MFFKSIISLIWFTTVIFQDVDSFAIGEKVFIIFLFSNLKKNVGLPADKIKF